MSTATGKPPPCPDCGRRGNCPSCRKRRMGEGDTRPVAPPRPEHLRPVPAEPIYDDAPPPGDEHAPDDVAPPARDTGTPDDEASSWRPHNIAAVVEGGQEPPPPLLLRRDDGQALLYAGRVNGFHGESESAKSWIAQYAVAQELIAGCVGLYLDFEDCAENVVARLRALGVPLDALVERFVYIRPHEPLDEAAHGELRAVLELKPTIAVIDGMTDAMTMHGLNPLSNEDVAKFFRMLPKPLARRGPGVLLIDHVTKDKEHRGRFAIGGQHKLAAIDGAAYNVEAVRPFGRGQTGVSKLVVAKDRNGWVRRLGTSTVAEFHLSANDAGDDVTVKAVGHSIAEPDKPFRPTYLMERISRAVELAPRNKRDVRSLKGASDGKDLALKLLIAEGYVSESKAGKALEYRSIKPYREAEDGE